MSAVIISKQRISYTDIPQVFTEGKPVIFWDTCSMLYFNSMIDRRAYGEYDCNYKLFELVESGKVYSVTSAIVFQEYNKHHEKLHYTDVSKEASLKNVMRKYGKIKGEPMKTDLEKGMQALDLSQQMDEMIARIWANTCVIEEDTFFMQKAHQRVMSEIAPSNVKQEYKDCYIWETFLTLCDLIPHKDVSWFISENKEDFCGKGSNTLFNEIVDDLNQAHGKFALKRSELYVDVARHIGLIP